jgi:hypothetical protein
MSAGFAEGGRAILDMGEEEYREAGVNAKPGAPYRREPRLFAATTLLRWKADPWATARSLPSPTWTENLPSAFAFFLMSG